MNHSVVHFHFPDEKKLTEDITGPNSIILSWIDNQVKISPFIEINLITIYSDGEGTHLVYELLPRKKLNREYAFRHLALQDINSN